MTNRPTFQIVRVECDAIGIVANYPEDAPMSTIVQCRRCGGARGTLRDLRRLALSDRRDLVDLDLTVTG